jgi:hypothetical protein
MGYKLLGSGEITEKSTGNPVRDMFVNRYPDMTLFLLRGYDDGTGTTDTLRVFFKSEDAKNGLDEVRGGACGKRSANDFYIQDATPLELEGGKLDEMTGDFIGSVTGIYHEVRNSMASVSPAK